MTDKKKIEASIKSILEALGEDPNRPGLIDTPERVANLYTELFSGLKRDPAKELTTVFKEDTSELIVLKNLPFNSLCEHHLLPFDGTVTVGYVSNQLIAGIGTIARSIEILSRKPQMQERLTKQISDLLENILKPTGVGIVIEAKHLCMTINNPKTNDSKLVTTCFSGSLKDTTHYREEFLKLIGKETLDE
tara:strand:+ start:6085 stop:6657 length:573 start_codon:yes stop_codon:yes gene_type:complete